MNASLLFQENRRQILEIAARHGAHNVRVFGSVARGESTDKSDIDLLVDLEQGRTLGDHVRLIRELRELLGCKVDAATINGLKPRIRSKVLEEAIPL